MAKHDRYLAVMEASTEHTYERDVLGIEYWTTHECPVTGEWIDFYMPAREDADTEEAENGEDADEDTDDEDEEDDGEEEGDEEDEEAAA